MSHLAIGTGAQRGRVARSQRKFLQVTSVSRSCEKTEGEEKIRCRLKVGTPSLRAVGVRHGVGRRADAIPI